MGCGQKGCCCNYEDGTGYKLNSCDSAKGYAYRGCNSCWGADACFKTNNINVGTSCVTVGVHASLYQIVPSIMIHVLVQIHANLCKDLPFMTDHVMVVFLVSRWKMLPSEMDRVTTTTSTAMATKAAAVVNML